MKWTLTPGRRVAFMARWSDVWSHWESTGQAAGYASKDEARYTFTEAHGGNRSLNDLDEHAYNIVMFEMASQLQGHRCPQPRDAWRARRIAKIEHLAAELRPDAPETYIAGALHNLAREIDPPKWRTALPNGKLQSLLNNLDRQARINRKSNQNPNMARSRIKFLLA